MVMISSNFTTNESFNVNRFLKTYLGNESQKSDNPFDHGVIRNLIIFFNSRFNYPPNGRLLVINHPRYKSRLERLGYELGVDFEMDSSRSSS